MSQPPIDPSNPSEETPIPLEATESPISNPAEAEKSYEDHPDGSRKEMLSYGLFSIVDEMASAGFRNLTMLLSIGFGVSPLVGGFLNGIKTLWDGICDPIMAHITDNFRSRWGRRRPFILFGCLLMAIVSWCSWAFLPNTSNLQPNTPVVPKVEFSDAQSDLFGKMLLGYGVKPFDLHVNLEVSPEHGLTESELEAYATTIVNDLKINSKGIIAWSESDAQAQGENPLYLLKVKLLESNPVHIPDSEGLDTLGGLTIETSLFHEGEVVSGPQVIQMNLLPDLRPDPPKRQIIFLTRAINFFTGGPEEVALQAQMPHGESYLNIYRKRGMESAFKTAMQFAAIEMIGDRFALPYWRALPEDGSFDTDEKTRLKKKALDQWASNPQQFRTLAFGSGLDINITESGEPTAEEISLLTEFKQRENLETDAAAYAYFWESNDIDLAASRVGLVVKPKQLRKNRTAWEKVSMGFSEITGSTPEDRHLILFILAMFLLMATANTVYSAPFYAFGIEIAPSYDGRTQVVAYRAFFSNSMNIIMTGFLPFCLLPIFYSAREGAYLLSSVMFFVAVIAAIIAFRGTREHPVPPKPPKDTPKFWKAVRQIGSNREFWRITGIYILMGQIIGLFNGLGTFIAIYYVFEGNLLMGAAYGAMTQMIATFLSFAIIPLIVGLCKKFEKHIALRMALGWMIIGTALKYVCYNPKIPELMFILPFFYSVGIGTLYNVLSTMMGDVTDLDELYHGYRREGMFGAVMALIMKSVATFGAMISGIVVVAAGFEISKGIYQDPGVFNRMLFLFSIVPAIGISSCFLLLRKYPLTRERMTEIKAQLAVNRRLSAEEAATSQE